MSARFEAILQGLVSAERLTWKSLLDRSHLLPYWTRRLRREIEVAYEQDNLLEQSLPFALNQPTGQFGNAPGAHSEWVTFQLQLLLAGGGRYQHERATEAWRQLAAKRDSLRLTIAQHAAMENLSRGATPPVSGHDNPHYFDDGACFRAIPLLFADRGTLQDDVQMDAGITNAEDGIWAAQAFAAALRGAVDTADSAVAVALALEYVPDGSWLSQEVERTLGFAREVETPFELIDLLANNASNHAYNYGNSAPESLALTLAIISRTRGELHSSLLAALGLPKTSGSVAPLVGALCGALGNPPAGPAGGQPLRGVALPHLAGSDPLELLRELSALAL